MADESGAAKDFTSSLSDNTSPNGELKPERKLLHELIVQAVTERNISASAKDFDKQLKKSLDAVQNLDAYKNLAAKPDFSRADIAAILDAAAIPRLPEKALKEQTTAIIENATIFVSGGPATGKSKLVDGIQQRYPDITENAAKINPDDYRQFFVRPDTPSSNFASYSQSEVQNIMGKIDARLSEKMAAGHAPNILIDRVAPSEAEMEIAKKSGQLISVIGTLPPEAALERAAIRNQKIGRDVPKNVVIGGAQWVSQTAADTINHPNLSYLIYDTNVPMNADPTKVAEWDNPNKRLVVSDPDKFIDFAERRALNPNAASPDQLFGDKKGAPVVAEGIKSFTDKGAEVDFYNKEGNAFAVFNKEGAEILPDAAIGRGKEFLADLKNSFIALAAAKVPEPEAAPANKEVQEAGLEPKRLPSADTPERTQGFNSGTRFRALTALGKAAGVVAKADAALGPAGGLIGVGLAAGVSGAILYEKGSLKDAVSGGAKVLAENVVPNSTRIDPPQSSLEKAFRYAETTTGTVSSTAGVIALGAAGVAGVSVLAAPETAGTSLVPAGGAAGVAVVAGGVSVVSGLATLGISVTRDALHAAGAPVEGGIITSGYNAAHDYLYPPDKKEGAAVAKPADVAAPVSPAPAIPLATQPKPPPVLRRPAFGPSL